LSATWKYTYDVVNNPTDIQNCSGPKRRRSIARRTFVVRPHAWRWNTTGHSSVHQSLQQRQSARLPFLMHVFWIDVGQPRANRGISVVAADLADALEMCFPLDAADAVVHWGGVPIELSYKYDVSVIVEDVIELVDSCLRGRSLKTRFGSNTFNAEWTIRVEGDSIGITAQWHSVSGNKEELLNQVPTLVVPRRDFLKQWSGLLETALWGVAETSVKIRDQQLFHDAQALVRRVAAMDVAVNRSSKDTNE
jgi:hypothetical protein